ncbi:DUF418 domain-containing protein [Staphylococcus succinus]|uniref:DUF418 domain-containing protein n=1 Tax=Staphylococcus succinus TaxID=61015 RepID=UPI001C04DDE3|nr:DUF418 domain-containing protein [Staphylococcus succinus]MBU0437739.1 DUF418 domain-containing protein [Staphylococcus succinus]
MVKRIKSLDFIRGVAILGILLINIPAFQTVMEGFKFPNYSGIEVSINNLITIVIEKKFFGLFSILFGIGMGIFMDNSVKKNLSPYRMMSRRLVFLLMFGILHAIFIFSGSILAPYAIIGFITFGLYYFKADILKSIFIILSIVYTLGVILKLQNIEFSILNAFLNDSMLIIIFFIFGLYLTKSGYIYNESTGKNKSKRNYGILLLLGLIIIFAIFLYMTGSFAKIDKQSISLLVIPQTILYFIILENISLRNNLKYLKLFFSTIGKMAFTNYVMQSVIGIILIKILGIVYPTPISVLYLSVLIVIINYVFSFVILKYYKQGPLEWLWRKFTYKKVYKNT